MSKLASEIFFSSFQSIFRRWEGHFQMWSLKPELQSCTKIGEALSLVHTEYLTNSHWPQFRCSQWNLCTIIGANENWLNILCGPMRVLPRFWCSSRRKNLLSQAFLASLWWVQVKIVLTVKTLYVQEGYKCLILAEGAQKVGEFSCYFSNPPAQRLTTLVSHSEANP